MAINELKTWLIAYDIRERRRLARVHRYLKGEAVPVQYSVFVARMNKSRLGMVRQRLAALIDRKCDDVRIYQIPERAEIAEFGAQGFSEGILLLDGSKASFTLPFTSQAARDKLQQVLDLE